jgi:FAD/FMN-containing dehydrogenase
MKPFSFGAFNGSIPFLILFSHRAAFEFMDGPVISLVNRVNPDVLTPLPSLGHPYYILVETHGSNQENDQLKMDAFVEQAFEQECVADGVLASSVQQIEDIWKVRESCNPTCASSGYVYKYDVSLPIREFPLFSEELKTAMAPHSSDLELVHWGHIIDGDLKCNIISMGNFDLDQDLQNTINEHVFQGVQKRGGSISAEHGMGQFKHEYMPRIHPPETLNKMYDVKKLFDPNGILNPGKYLPDNE